MYRPDWFPFKLLTAMLVATNAMVSSGAMAHEIEIYAAARSALIYPEYLDKAAMQRCGISYDKLLEAARKGLKRTGLEFVKNPDADADADLDFYLNVTLLTGTSSCIANVMIEAKTRAESLSVTFKKGTVGPTRISLDSSGGTITGPPNGFAARLYSFVTEVSEKLALKILEGIATEKRWDDLKRGLEQKKGE